MATAVPDKAVYEQARRVVDVMFKNRVWPTPVNYSLWSHAVREPAGEIGVALTRLVQSGEPLTESATEALAATLAPQDKLLIGPADETREAGESLDREMAAVTGAVAAAQKSSVTFEAVLERAIAELSGPTTAPALQQLLSSLATDTRQVRGQRDVLQTRLAASGLEITRLRRSVERGSRQARTDALTNLPNRQAFDVTLEEACGAAHASGSGLVLAILDIDHFKRFNDTWGHQTGDQVLRYVGGVAGRIAGETRFAARYGGEEFAILFPGETEAEASQVIQGMMGEVSKAVLKRRASNQDLGAVTVSAGLALLRPSDSCESLFARADGALYASKNAGRNRLTCG
jgi:diguanylate cyclase